MSRARRAPIRADPAPAAVRRDVLGTIVQQRRADIERELGGPADETGLDGVGIGAPNRDPGRGAASVDPLSSLLRPGLHLIAEIKRRSPSAGQLAGELDIVARARAYHAGGAAAISVLVEPRFFGGSLGDLRAVRTAVPVPLLAKEFVVDARQLAALRDAGADLVLLIAAMHPGRILASLVRAARDAGLEPLVEAHDRREAERAVASDARVIGINNRDLRTLHVDPDRAARLRDAIPDDRLAVVESGIRSPSDVEALLALGFDAALVGEALMRGGDEPREVAALTHAFVSAGRPPADAEDLPGAARRASVKICGITDEAGVLAAVAAGVDAIGLNFVRGTRRFLEVREAAPLAALIREARGDIARPAIVGIVADQAADEVAAIVREVGLERVQVSGTEPLGEVARIEAPVVRVLHVPPSVPAGGPRTAAAGHGPDGIDVDEVAGGLIERGRAVLALPNVVGLMLDAADPFVPGGTGIRVDAEVARRVALQLPVWLAGGLTPATVGEALRRVPAIGVDVASGVERTDASRLRPAKDPSRIALFAKRARAARADRPTVPARPIIASAGLVDADERGRWGLDRGFGGRYVPETLVAALVELEDAYARLRDDPRYWARIRVLGARYVGRPTPLYRADRLAAALEAATGREPGRLRLYLKREDLNHTGAHKINNALGQALLTRELGKADVVAETGAGQHGVATATVCALLDLRCRVYMGAEDVRRQAPNVLRMHALGAEVVPVTSGSATLKDAINEAMRDWVTNVRTSHYVLGSAVGPHPFPTIVRDLQRVIGDEAAVQVVEDAGRLPDAVVACVGGGSNAIGLFARFIGEPGVRLVGVEAAGDGLQTPRHAAALAGGTPGILHGARSYLLQDADGQVLEAHSISAGLDYPGIGPQLSALFAAGRLEIEHATDQEALEGLRLVARTEGILAALEPSHAVAALLRVLAPGASQPLTSDAVVVLGMSGRGDKDLAALDPATE